MCLLTASTLHHRVYNVSSPYAWSVADWCERLAADWPGFTWSIAEDANVAFFADNAPMALDRLAATGYRASYDVGAAYEDYRAWASRA